MTENSQKSQSNLAQPSLFIPHGGGPCFFMDDPAGRWTGMGDFLRQLLASLPARPKAILLVSAHWETDGFAFTGHAAPELIFDYYGFPPHTYELRYPAPGAPDLAARAAGLLQAAGFKAMVDPDHGLDHGAFVPLMLAAPDADIPVVEMSLDRSLDPAMHQAAGRALAVLREEGVLIIGSGMSFHNMRAYGNPAATAQAELFDQYLTKAATAPSKDRAEALNQWAQAPGGQFAHPREEHLLPLMVAAGASDQAGARIYNERVLEVAISAYRFD